ncbi:hypothetical protein ACQ5SO_01340 [Rhodovulum sp. DZ06]|uniref:hypothetical protein n=1 Tax=Rhodovulum sp. DZ06 TaxID=3425126 RepID=UPI003D347569
MKAAPMSTPQPPADDDAGAPADAPIVAPSDRAPRPLRNRVDPEGGLHAVPARGGMMGNRGRLHDAGGRVLRRWTTTAWICCALSFRGRRRAPMPPRGYTALFFLDEAAALAAGHRPCFECRRADALAYAEAFARGAGLRGGRARAAAMDAALHAQRLGPRPHVAPAADPAALPQGAMLLDAGGRALLRVEDGVRPWGWAGYGAREALPGRAALLTPPASVAALREGWRVMVHPSGDAEAP